MPIDLEALKRHLLWHLDSERAPPTSATIEIEPRRSVLFLYADNAGAQRAHDILRALHVELSATGDSLYTLKVLTVNAPKMASGWGPRAAGRGIPCDPRTCCTIPQPRNPTNGNPTRICYLDHPAGAGPLPAATHPAEPAGSSQLARMGCHRHHTSSSTSSVDRPSDRHHGAAPEMRRSAGECSGSSRHGAPAACRVPGRQLRALLSPLRPSASNCFLPAPRRLDAEQPFSGDREMYIVMQRGHACGIKYVGSLTFPLVLFDSLAGARIFRAVAALLHMEFCKPSSARVVTHLERCFKGLLTPKLQRLLAADCCAFVGRPRADVSQRGVERYLTGVVHPMLARR